MKTEAARSDFSRAFKSRLTPMIACLVSVGLCLAYAKFRGELPNWWMAHGGGIPYVLFWILFVYTLILKPKFILRICLAVVIATCGLEVLQLWNPEPLASFRATKFGAALLGSTFVWNDIPPYFIGGGIGYLTLVLLEKTSSTRN